MKKLSKISNGVHFIGIGGIGVSALARYYLKRGDTVSGSDLASSEITKDLEKLGAKIHIGPHSAKNVPNIVDLVIYSPAVRPTNPEYVRAKKLKIENCKLKICSYPQALGELTKQYFTIAVSGTHGKSTTTAMLGILLEKAGLDPTVIVGTKIREFGDSNFRMGGKVVTSNSQPATSNQIPDTSYLVIEADEHFASFLNYWPKILVLTNIEADHLDYYKNLNNILKTFKKYISHLPKDGYLVINGDDKNIKRIINNDQLTINKSRINKYGFSQAKDVKRLRKIMKIPGDHNIMDALSALAVARILKIPDKISFKALSEYKGAWRRFDISKITVNKKQITLINDYAHHPTKVRVTLKAAREKYPKGKIWCIYQPHQYQRTYYLFKDFVKVFKDAPVDKLIITDIFDVAGRETPEVSKKVSSEKLVKTIGRKNTIYLPKDKIIDYLNTNLKGKEVVILMGAGNIYNLSARLKEKP
ncbi:MAG: UDP-N-acetylmuramate--L-alanine ligase [Candidatus Pacebacteria bacterium]|nr:UDP-N-acetylmuramate--L-alanine ligase [Candidatus Paceibacterota bacterium]